MTKVHHNPSVGLPLSRGKEQHITVRHVRLSENTEQRVMFHTRPRRNRVTCVTRNNPTIYVFPDGNGYLALIRNGAGASARTPDKAFAKAAATYWS